jgi:hypothetical protein
MILRTLSKNNTFQKQNTHMRGPKIKQHVSKNNTFQNKTTKQHKHAQFGAWLWKGKPVRICDASNKKIKFGAAAHNFLRYVLWENYE